MRVFTKVLTVFVLVFSTIPTVAQAEIFFIEDQDDRFTITFPDLWKKVGNQKPDDKLTILGPDGNNHLICRVRVRPDRRFVIFPHQFDDEIQRIAVSAEFWKNYLGEYNAVYVEEFKDGAGLGRGYAGLVEATYETDSSVPVKKKGIMLASLYHDQLYVVDCSAEESVYLKWRPAFLGIIKSVDFDPVVYEPIHGHYRHFDEDAPVIIEGPKSLDVYKH